MEEKTSVKGVLGEDAFQKATDRETRLRNARNMLTVVHAMIYPPEIIKNECPGHGLSFDIRYGLAHILEQVQDALEENCTAFCYCYEEKTQAKANERTDVHTTAMQGRGIK